MGKNGNIKVGWKEVSQFDSLMSEVLFLPLQGNITLENCGYTFGHLHFQMHETIQFYTQVLK
jgi:hypothetical protein